MAVTATADIGKLANDTCKMWEAFSFRFSIRSIPYRITMCSINGIDIRGGKNLSIISFIFYAPNIYFYAYSIFD